MHKLILTSQARRDMHQIKDYISRRLQNPIAAKNTLSALIKEFRKLEQFPAMGPVVLDEMGAATSERVLACKNYLAFYRIEKADVYIDRVLHGRQDYLASLFGENLSSDDGDI